MKDYTKIVLYFDSIVTLNSFFRGHYRHILFHYTKINKSFYFLCMKFSAVVFLNPNVI